MSSWGHYSNEELGIKRDITGAQFKSRGYSVGDIECARDASPIEMFYTHWGTNGKYFLRTFKRQLKNGGYKAGYKEMQQISEEWRDANGGSEEGFEVEGWETAWELLNEAKEKEKTQPFKKPKPKPLVPKDIPTNKIVDPVNYNWASDKMKFAVVEQAKALGWKENGKGGWLLTGNLRHPLFPDRDAYNNAAHFLIKEKKRRIASEGGSQPKSTTSSKSTSRAKTSTAKSKTSTTKSKTSTSRRRK